MPADSTDLEEGITVDLDARGHVIGIEVLGACERLGSDPVAHVEIERLADGEGAKPRRTRG